MTCFVGLDVSQKMTACRPQTMRGQCSSVPEQISILTRRHAGDDDRIGNRDRSDDAMARGHSRSLSFFGRPPFRPLARLAEMIEGRISSINTNKMNGWGTWIRTKIDGVRVRCSTVELSPTRSPQKALKRMTLACRSVV